MPSASELATVVLQPPPIQVNRIASCYRLALDGGIPHTVLEEVDAIDLAEFRDYLKRIPFAFGDFFPSMSGRALIGRRRSPVPGDCHPGDLLPGCLRDGRAYGSRMGFGVEIGEIYLGGEPP